MQYQDLIFYMPKLNKREKLYRYYVENNLILYGVGNHSIELGKMQYVFFSFLELLFLLLFLNAPDDFLRNIHIQCLVSFY